MGEERITLGQGCQAQCCSGKWDLGLVNTDESVWKLWVKDRGLMLMLMLQETGGLKERMRLKGINGKLHGEINWGKELDETLALVD